MLLSPLRRLSPVGNISSGGSWTPQSPLGGETPDFWVKKNSRSGLTLVDSVNSPTNDITIQPSYLSTGGVTAYGYINDNGALDIYDTDFTICGWVNILQNTAAARYPLGGKYIAGNLQGRYGFNTSITTGYFHALAQSSGTTVDIASTINASTCGKAFLLMDINQTTKKVRFFIWTAATGYNQIGVDTSFTGTFPHMDNAYRFYSGCINTVTTGAPISYSQSEFSDVRLFRRILTPTEQTTLLNRGSVANPLAYYPWNNMYGYDCSGNNYHLTTSGITKTQIIYGSLGSRQALDVGYTRHTLFPNLEIQIPYTHTSVPCNVAPAGYTKDADIPGDALNHNGANSYLMPVAGTIDRSNTTTCTKLAVENNNNPFYYLVAYKAGLHSVEATNRNIASFFTNNYRGQNYFKRNGRTITDWVHYATNKTGADYDKAIAWSAENMNFAFGSGRYLSMGIYSTWASSTCLRIGASLAKEGPFYPIAQPVLEPWSYTHVGNAKVLPLNTNKCNGSAAPIVGETNFIMTFECQDANIASISAPVYKSHNGIDWKYLTHFPNSPLFNWAGNWFVENDDPTDYTNIHYISFKTDTKTIVETHPLDSSFTTWSAAVTIFNVGTPIPYNPVVWLMNGEYHMFYSAYISGDNTHYMHHAKCTHDPFNASNDWADFQTGNWSGLGSCESFSLINLGGTNWILYAWELVSGSHQFYSLSTDDCATWSAKTNIDSLNSPLEVSVDVLRLK